MNLPLEYLQKPLDEYLWRIRWLTHGVQFLIVPSNERYRLQRKGEKWKRARGPALASIAGERSTSGITESAKFRPSPHLSMGGTVYPDGTLLSTLIFSLLVEVFVVVEGAGELVHVSLEWLQMMSINVGTAKAWVMFCVQDSSVVSLVVLYAPLF